jgi:hypothetical protein
VLLGALGGVDRLQQQRVGVLVLPGAQEAVREFEHPAEQSAALVQVQQGLAEVARVADNYNHLHEQPTLFYAVALAAQLAGVVDPLSVGLAWAYVGLRVAPSFVQATRNVIPVRFAVFTLGSFALLALLVRTALRAL